jgi:hypothetical protein
MHVKDGILSSLIISLQYIVDMGFAASYPDKRSKQERCTICGRVFDSIEALNAHKQMDHSEFSHQPAGVS